MLCGPFCLLKSLVNLLLFFITLSLCLTNVICLTKKKITNDRALSVIGSISGWLKWANTYNLQISLQLNELKESIGGSVNEQI